MSEEVKVFETQDDIDTKRVMEIFGDVERTKRFVAWIDEIVAEFVSELSDLADNHDRTTDGKARCIMGKISAYRRMKDASVRALQLAGGKPPAGVRADTAVGVV